MLVVVPIETSELTRGKGASCGADNEASKLAHRSASVATNTERWISRGLMALPLKVERGWAPSPVNLALVATDHCNRFLGLGPAVVTRERRVQVPRRRRFGRAIAAWRRTRGGVWSVSPLRSRAWGLALGDVSPLPACAV